MVCYFHSYMVMRWSTVTCTGMVVILPVLMLTGVSKDPLSIWRRNSQRGSGPCMMEKPQESNIWTMKTAQISLNFMPPKVIFCIPFYLYLPAFPWEIFKVLFVDAESIRHHCSLLSGQIYSRSFGETDVVILPWAKREIRIRSLQMDFPWDIVGPCKFFTAVSVSRMFGFGESR